MADASTIALQTFLELQKIKSMINNTKIELWQANTNYPMNKPVRYGGKLYICNTAHVSGLDFDESKFDLVSGTSSGGGSGGGTTYSAGNGISISSDVISVKLDGQTLSESSSGLKVNTLNADTVSISNLEADNFKTGVISTDWAFTDNSDSKVPTQKAVKTYVDLMAQGISMKAPVRVATTTEIDLGTGLVAGTVIDGVTLVTGDRVLVKDQVSNKKQNGIYVVKSSGVPDRAPDFDDSPDTEINGGETVFIQEGTLNHDCGYVLISDASVVLGTSDLQFEQFSGAGQLIPGDALNKVGNRLDVVADGSTLEVASDALRVKDAGISAAKLSSDAVETAKIKDANVTTAKLADDSVTKEKIDAGVAGNGLGQNADGSLEVKVDGSTLEITTDTMNVKDAGISAAKLASDAVETAKIKDANVTTAKLADDSVTKEKIDAGVAGTGLKQNTNGSLEVDTANLPFSNANFTSTTIPTAIVELFQSASNGKTTIATAITGKGGTASGSNTFSQLASAISALPSGGVTQEVKLNLTAPYTKTISVSNLTDLANLCSSILQFVIDPPNYSKFVCDFNNGDAASFSPNFNSNYVLFDGRMRLVTSYSLTVDGGVSLGAGTKYTSGTIDPSIFNSISSVVMTPSGVSISATPLAQVIKANGDIDITGIDHITNITLTGTATGSGKVKLAVSTDSGASWKTFYGGSWVSLNPDNKADFASFGMDASTLTGLTSAQFIAGVAGATKIRFAYYLDRPTVADDANTDSISMGIIMPGYFIIAPTANYSLTYNAGSKTISYEIFTSGTYSFNYVN